MRCYIVCDIQGKVERHGDCPDIDYDKQAHNPGEYICEGIIVDTKQKIKHDGVAADGTLTNPRIVDKTQAEIDRDNPPPPVIAPAERMIRIKQKDWDALAARVQVLESKP